jgi:hypothetical protein
VVPASQVPGQIVAHDRGHLVLGKGDEPFDVVDGEPARISLGSEQFVRARHRATGDADPGQYLMTYWSSAEPKEMLHDMAVVREKLAALGRCDQINRDFRATWRERMHLVEGYANRAYPTPPDAAFLVNHDAVIVTVTAPPIGGCWGAWYDTIGVAELFADPEITAAYNLMPITGLTDQPSAHLHYLATGADRQDAIAGVFERGAQPGPDVLYRATYTAQHRGRPRFYS